MRYIVSGVNFRTEGIHVRAWSQGHVDGRYVRSVYRRMTGKRLKSFPVIPLKDLVSSIVFHRPRNVYLLDYLEYDKAAAKALLTERFGWVDYGGKHYESVYTRFYQGWILPQRFGYDKRRMHLSTLIMSGQVDARRRACRARASAVRAGARRRGPRVRRQEARHQQSASSTS